MDKTDVARINTFKIGMVGKSTSFKRKTSGCPVIRCQGGLTQSTTGYVPITSLTPCCVLFPYLSDSNQASVIFIALKRKGFPPLPPPIYFITARLNEFIF